MARRFRRLDLDDIAGAEIMDAVHCAELGAFWRHRGKPDQVGMVELDVLDVRQPSRADVQLKIGQPLRGVAVATPAMRATRWSFAGRSASISNVACRLRFPADRSASPIGPR